jgi:hypothetical protein
MNGGMKCMVVRNAWWYKMHGGTKCTVVLNAWWYEMHGGTKLMDSKIDKQILTLKLVFRHII